MRGFSARLFAAVVAVMLLGPAMGTREARAQAMGTGAFVGSYRVSDYLGAPGLYGMSYGFASYGMPQTYSVFSAYPGPSYGTNYPPYGILPGRFGVGLWRPGFAQAGYVYGASYFPQSFSYRTFPIGAEIGLAPVGSNMAPPPPVGLYAPALGPGFPYGW
jgi:hypothetical protein